MIDVAALPDVFRPTNDPAWILEDLANDAMRESSRESRFSVSNGFLGVRCSRAINRADGLASPPRTYVAGLFDSLGNGAPIAALVPAAGWLALRIETGIPVLDNRALHVAAHRLVLDMKRGLVITHGRQTDPALPRGEIGTLHFVSLGARSVGVQVVALRVDDSGIALSLNAPIEEMGFGLVLTDLEPDYRAYRTTCSGKRLAMSVGSSLTVGHTAAIATRERSGSPLWTWSSRAAEPVLFERTVAIVRGDRDDDAVETRVRAEFDRARDLGWAKLLAEHEAAWAVRWHASDIEITGDDRAQHALRFAIYHLNGAANPADEHVSVGARALTGEEYHGHVFWDTDIYLVPFYTMTWPEAARALLMYRFHTLDGARAKAKRLGWGGALYAWESADTGDETAPHSVVGPDRAIVPVLSGLQEQHISADVAYAVWQYWHATGDDEFLRLAGAEILFETARFWASRATGDVDGRRHIRGVIGPDEYHENVDDNAFTNTMARWNLVRATEIAALLAERFPSDWSRVAGRLQIEDAELDLWREVARTLACGENAETGLLEQFAGYFRLEDIDLAAYAKRSVPMDVVLGRERTQRSQIVKQADVVALLALLPTEFSEPEIARNFAYYEPRCSHGSSLSAAMHAVVSARLGESDIALRYFEATAAIDLDDTHAAISGGIHIAAQGGLWLATVIGFCGVSLRDDGLALDPRMPSKWLSVAFRLQWRGRSIHLEIDVANERVIASLERGETMRIYIGAAAGVLAVGAPITERFTNVA